MKNYLFTIGTLLLIVSALITLNLFYQQRLQMDMAEQISKHQLLLAQSAASDMETCLKGLGEESHALALMLSDFMREKRVLLKERLDEYFQRQPSFRAKVALYNKRGDVVYSRTDGTSLVSNWEDVRKASGLLPGELLMRHDSYLIYVITPIYRGNLLEGFLLFENPIYFVAKRFLSHIKTGTRAYAWMMDSLGNLLYHPTQPDMIGKNLYDTDDSCFQCHISFNLEKKVVEGKTRDYGRYLAPTGDDKILAFSKANVGDATWIIAVSTPYSEVIYAMKKSLGVYSILIITIFITAGFATTLLIVYHRKKVKAEEIAKHEKELEQYAHELEHKVQERTQELVSEKEKLDTVVSAMGGGILLIDRQGKIQWANKKMFEMAGTDIIGKACEEICYECDISGMYEHDNIETAIVSNLFGQKDTYFQITTAPVKGIKGEAHGYIRLVQDVTEMKKMEEQIAHSEKLASLGRLIAGIAHEIGNPLTSIFSFVQILRDMEEDAFKKESLDTMYFHINRISEIIKQLSTFSKAQAGEQKLSRVSVNAIIEKSVNLIQYDKKAKNMKIEKELSSTLPDITLDPNQLSQVFVNLILNALDAMPEGGTLTVRSMVVGRNILIQFEDTGLGIPKEDLHKIFDPFYTTKERGTGLGLSVSYNLVNKMGGELSVESDEEEGSVFTIKIPIES